MPDGSHWLQGDASPPTPAYTLTVSGRDIIDYVPYDVRPIRWTESGANAVGTLRFTVSDPSITLNWAPRAAVQLRDNANDKILFGGILLRRTYKPMPGGGRWVECEVASWDWWLDNRMIVRWQSKKKKNGKVRRIASDRQMVLNVIRKRVPMLNAWMAQVDETNTDMDYIRIAGKTARETLERIAQEAAPGDGETWLNAATRGYYVDYNANVHYYKKPEGYTAPYRIADGSYVTDVLATSGLHEYWSLREESGTVAYGQSDDLTHTGSWTSGVTAGMVNEPGYRAVTVNGAYASGSYTTPGDTFTLECWFKRASSGAEWLIHSNANTDFALGFDASDKIWLSKVGGASSYTSTAAYTDTDWHHLVMAHDSSSTICYVDGATVAGSGSNQTFTGGARTLSLLATSAGAVSFSGSAQHFATYDAKLSSADVTAHYRQGVSITPEDLEYSIDHAEAVERVYIRGKNKAGSGWAMMSAARETGYAHAIIDKPRSNTVTKRKRLSRAFLRGKRAIIGGRFSVTERHGWRAGQSIYITDATLGISNKQLEVSAVNGELSADGATYEIEFGALDWRLTRELRRQRSQYARRDG